MVTPRLCGRRAHPALAAGLAEVDVDVLDVADLTDGGAAVEVHAADLAGGQADLPQSPSLAMSCAPTPAERHSWPPPPSFSSTLWIIVPSGMIAQRQAVARLDVGVARRDHLVARP